MSLKQLSKFISCMLSHSVSFSQLEDSTEQGGWWWMQNSIPIKGHEFLLQGDNLNFAAAPLP